MISLQSQTSARLACSGLSGTSAGAPSMDSIGMLHQPWLSRIPSAGPLGLWLFDAFCAGNRNSWRLSPSSSPLHFKWCKGLLHWERFQKCSILMNWFWDMIWYDMIPFPCRLWMFRAKVSRQQSCSATAVHLPHPPQKSYNCRWVVAPTSHFRRKTLFFRVFVACSWLADPFAKNISKSVFFVGSTTALQILVAGSPIFPAPDPPGPSPSPWSAASVRLPFVSLGNEVKQFPGKSRALTNKKEWESIRKYDTINQFLPILFYLKI